jgi:Kef-type K+ transport system membrane component KefB/Trk K+ transport system NAD-binding subunit
MHSIVQEIACSLIAATVAGLLCHGLGQPIILGYVLAGVIIGPQLGLSLVADIHTIEILSELGLILLLFIIGLEINLRELLASGKKLLITAGGQFPLGVIVGLAFFSIWPLPWIETRLDVVYLALLCGLSSTAIVVKALYDKNELDTMPGKLTLATLVLQDFYAILLLAAQPSMANPSLLPLLKAFGSTIVLIVFGFLISKYVLSRLFHSIAQTPEMVVCVSLAWCACAAGAAQLLGVSQEMGALVAGLSISAFPYSVHVTAKTLPLRDFFLTLFFVSLGMKMSIPEGPILIPVLVVSCFVILSRFLSVYPLVAAVGAGRRAAFITSLNLAQLSEFSLVIGSLGVSFGHISKDLVSLLVFSMVILSVLSSYAIRFSHPLFLAFDGLLSKIAPEEAAQKLSPPLVHRPYNVVFLGFHRSARALFKSIEAQHPELLPEILVVDFNPITLEELKAKGIGVLFGDIGSYDTLKHAHLEKAKVVLSTIPDMLLKGTDNRSLTRIVRSLAPRTWMVATADDSNHERKLRKEGVDLAVRPFDLMGEWLATFVRQTIVHTEEAEKTMLQVSATGQWIVPAVAHLQQVNNNDN